MSDVTRLRYSATFGQKYDLWLNRRLQALATDFQSDTSDKPSLHLEIHKLLEQMNIFRAASNMWRGRVTNSAQVSGITLGIALS